MNMNNYITLMYIDVSLVKLEIREPRRISDVISAAVFGGTEWELKEQVPLFWIYS